MSTDVAIHKACGHPQNPRAFTSKPALTLLPARSERSRPVTRLHAACSGGGLDPGEDMGRLASSSRDGTDAYGRCVALDSKWHLFTAKFLLRDLRCT